MAGSLPVKTENVLFRTNSFPFYSVFRLYSDFVSIYRCWHFGFLGCWCFDDWCGRRGFLVTDAGRR